MRPIPETDCYEILAGHNRTAAARLAGWTTIPAEIVEANDARAIVIATSTNLIQRQNLSIIERGKAYKGRLNQIFSRRLGAALRRQAFLMPWRWPRAYPNP